MRLITNTNTTHKSIFKKLLRKSITIDLVASYCDDETLEFVVGEIGKNKNNPKVRLLIGGNFAITHPGTLYKLSRELPGQVFIVMPEAPVIFQSNVYLFKTKNNYHTIVGSASCTEEGLKDDMVASIYQKKPDSTTLWKQSRKYVRNLIKSKDVHPLTTRFIARYENYFQQVENDSEWHSSSWEVKDALINHIDDLRIKAGEWVGQESNVSRVSAIENDYKAARKILKMFASQKSISESEAQHYLDQLMGSSGGPGLWNSNGFQGSKASILGNFDAFRDLIRYVQENRKEPADLLFNGMMGQAKNIKGVGVNMLSEILISFNPREFPKLHNSLVQSLVDHGDLAIKKSVSKYNGEDYQRFTDIVLDFTALLKFGSLIETDLFFTDVQDVLPDPVTQGTEDADPPEDEGDQDGDDLTDTDEAPPNN